MKKTTWTEEFKTFILRGNVLDMAVGVVVGTAFTAIVTSIVENLLTPIIALCMGSTDFSGFMVGPFGVGAVINAIITFLITAFVVFWIVKVVNKVSGKEKKAAEEAAKKAAEEAEAAANAKPTTEELLAEIRDLLKEQK